MKRTNKEIVAAKDMIQCILNWMYRKETTKVMDWELKHWIKNLDYELSKRKKK